MKLVKFMMPPKNLTCLIFCAKVNLPSKTELDTWN